MLWLLHRQILAQRESFAFFKPRAKCLYEGGNGGWNGQGPVVCKAGRMIDRWWWTNTECGKKKKKQGAFPGTKGISYSCIVITFTVIHLRPTPRGRAYDTPAMESEMLSYQAGWLSKSHKIPHASRFLCLLLFSSLIACEAVSPYLHPTCLWISLIFGVLYTPVNQQDGNPNKINEE